MNTYRVGQCYFQFPNHAADSVGIARYIEGGQVVEISVAWARFAADASEGITSPVKINRMPSVQQMLNKA